MKKHFSIKLPRKRLLLLILVFSLLTISVAAASTPNSSTYWQQGGDLSGFGQEIKKVWNLIGNPATGIALPLAAISLTFGAVKMFGDEKSVATGKKQILITLMALAAILLLPAVVKLGIDFGIQNGWDPTLGQNIP